MQASIVCDTAARACLSFCPSFCNHALQRRQQTCSVIRSRRRSNLLFRNTAKVRFGRASEKCSRHQWSRNRLYIHSAWHATRKGFYYGRTRRGGGGDDDEDNDIPHPKCRCFLPAVSAAAAANGSPPRRRLYDFLCFTQDDASRICIRIFRDFSSFSLLVLRRKRRTAEAAVIIDFLLERMKTKIDPRGCKPGRLMEGIYGLGRGIGFHAHTHTRARGK